MSTDGTRKLPAESFVSTVWVKQRPDLSEHLEQYLYEWKYVYTNRFSEVGKYNSVTSGQLMASEDGIDTEEEKCSVGNT